MVQKYQSPIRVYKYPFELIMAAYERRFPTCDMIPIFVSSDIVVDDKSEDGATHVIERRCKLNVDAPYLLRKLAGVDFVYFIQRNTLDLRARNLKIEAYNESFASRVVINEVCNYFVHPENPEWTCFEQSANLEVKSFFGCEHLVEKLAIKQYSANIAKGKEIIEFFIEKLRQEGITSVPVWVEPPESDKSVGDASEEINTDHSNLRDEAKEENPDEVKDELGEPRTLSKATEDLTLGASASSLKSHSLLTRQRSGSGDNKSLIPIIRCDSFSDEDNKFRLDADYIQRYLGNLSPLQESQLIQVRQWLHHLQRENLPNDAMLLRFLRATDFNLEKARELISQSLTWRKKYQVDKTLAEYSIPDVVRDYFPGAWHHNDKDGRPLYILRLGMMDVKGLIKSIGEEGLLRLTLHVCEEGLKLTEEATEQCDRAITTWALLLDLEGLNMRHLWAPGIKTLLRIIEIVGLLFPETMARCFIIRAPRVFPVLWTLVRTFIDDRTCAKFFFYGGNDYQAEPGGLQDYITEKYIPDFLGGSSKVLCSEGGLVPKSHYMTPEIFESLTLSDESIYKSIALSKGHIHEIVLENSDSGSLLTWDFDVLKNSVCFSLFRTKHTVSSTPSPPNGLNQMQYQAEPDHKSVIDKTWKEGVDYFKIDSSLVHDGESVQGSHVMTEGSFVLQWRFYHEKISKEPCLLMYYYEIFSSKEYRGSMSSLQSLSSMSSKSLNSGATVSCPSR